MEEEKRKENLSLDALISSLRGEFERSAKRISELEKENYELAEKLMDIEQELDRYRPLRDVGEKYNKIVERTKQVIQLLSEFDGVPQVEPRVLEVSKPEGLAKRIYEIITKNPNGLHRHSIVSTLGGVDTYKFEGALMLLRNMGLIKKDGEIYKSIR